MCKYILNILWSPITLLIGSGHQLLQVATWPRWCQTFAPPWCSATEESHRGCQGCGRCLGRFGVGGRVKSIPNLRHLWPFQSLRPPFLKYFQITWLNGYFRFHAVAKNCLWIALFQFVFERTGTVEWYTKSCSHSQYEFCRSMTPVWHEIAVSYTKGTMPCHYDYGWSMGNPFCQWKTLFNLLSTAYLQSW